MWEGSEAYYMIRGESISKTSKTLDKCLFSHVLNWRQVKGDKKVNCTSLSTGSSCSLFSNRRINYCQLKDFKGEGEFHAVLVNPLELREGEGWEFCMENFLKKIRVPYQKGKANLFSTAEGQYGLWQPCVFWSLFRGRKEILMRNQVRFSETLSSN